ncbi:MAG: homogentisate 1,2-dioxygenase, partial [Chloroflexota bacterium]
MFYVSRGSIPHTRHTQHRAPDGSLYAEELFGVEGFTGRSSLLYHLVPPTQTYKIEKVGPVKVERANLDTHQHRLVKSGGLVPRGHVAQGRYPLFFNNDVLMGVIRPADSMPENMFYRNGDGDEMLFFHEGSGVFESVFGNLAYGPGDYIVIPIGTTWRLRQDAGVGHRILYVESPTEIVAPQRYHNYYGQLLEHSPYSN